MKVLVVDDSNAMRMIVKRSLRQAGVDNLTVEEAENGKIAFGMIDAEKPDLVLCDWNMPEMTGIELLQKLNSENIRVKFGFVTSESTEDMRSAAREAGALFFLSKPFTADQLKDQISKL